MVKFEISDQRKIFCEIILVELLKDEVLFPYLYSAEDKILGVRHLSSLIESTPPSHFTYHMSREAMAG